MRRRAKYEVLAAVCLALAAAAALLAAAGAAFQEGLGVAAAAICAGVFFVPGLYFIGFAQRLRARDTALAHAATFARSRGRLRLRDLATELQVSPEDAEKILRKAIEEGYLAGRFEAPDRFVIQDEPAERGAGER